MKKKSLSQNQRCEDPLKMEPGVDACLRAPGNEEKKPEICLEMVRRWTSEEGRTGRCTVSEHHTTKDDVDAQRDY